MVSFRRITAAGAVVGLAALLAFSVTGCGSDARPRSPVGDKIHGDRLTIYVSVPEDGPSAVAGAAVEQGATIALDQVQRRIGKYQIQLSELDDASPTSSPVQWSAAVTQTDAAKAASDPTTIGYIGDLNSGASAISIPVLNAVGIAQVSPGSTAVGLTTNGLGAFPGEPLKYYPKKLRTFVRVVPNDVVQSEVQVELQRQEDCTSTYVLYDPEYDGEAAAQTFEAVAQKERFDALPAKRYTTTATPVATSYLSVGQSIKQSGANCVLIAALTDSDAPQLVTQIAQAAPSVKIFGTSGLAGSTFVDPAQGGVPLKLDGRILITDPAGSPSASLPGLAAFEREYTGVDNGNPQPVAVDGYEAMSLMLAAIREATDNGRTPAERVKVVKALFSTRDRPSPLGTFSIKPDGDTTLDSYGVYKVVNGELQFWRSLAG